MDYTQNAKIAQVTEKTLIIGVDVGSETHYARAFNWRGLVLETAPYPADILALGADGVNQIWREHKLRAVGMKRATTLVEAARKSVGMDGGVCARLDLRLLLEDFRRKQEQLKQITEMLEAETQKVPHIEKLLAIKGVGLITAAGFLAEVGDVGRFDSPKQIQKLAGLELKENSSGKHKGQSSISRRGRKKLMGKRPPFIGAGLQECKSTTKAEPVSRV